jgi:hypothetical protein
MPLRPSLKLDSFDRQKVRGVTANPHGFGFVLSGLLLKRLLTLEQVLCIGGKGFFEAAGHVRRKGGPAVQEVGKRRPSDAELLGSRGDRESLREDEFTDIGSDMSCG